MIHYSESVQRWVHCYGSDQRQVHYHESGQRQVHYSEMGSLSWRGSEMIHYSESAWRWVHCCGSDQRRFIIMSQDRDGFVILRWVWDMFITFSHLRGGFIVMSQVRGRFIILKEGRDGFITMSAQGWVYFYESVQMGSLLSWVGLGGRFIILRGARQSHCPGGVGGGGVGRNGLIFMILWGVKRRRGGHKSTCIQETSGKSSVTIYIPHKVTWLSTMTLWHFWTGLRTAPLLKKLI